MPKAALPALFALLMLLLAVSPAHAQGVQPIADRLDAIVSYPMVVAVDAQDERDLRRGVVTRLDDGRTFTSPAYWVGLTPQATPPAWTTSPGIWTATEFEAISRIEARRRPLGSWFIVIPMPIDAVGQGLWFGQERYELNWVPDPERSLLEASTREETRDFDAFWSAHLDEEALADPAVARAVGQYHRDPFQNWRARLLTDGLHPDRSRARETHSEMAGGLESLELELSIDTPGADLLQALARQQEARWQIILGRIWLIDPEVATRLKGRLMQTARFGQRTLPVWTSDTTELSRLAHDLLSPYVDDRTRVLRARAWLETQPRAIAWVSDDQGRVEAGSGRLMPTFRVVSMPPTEGGSLLMIETGAIDPELVTLPPHVATSVRAPVDPVDIVSMSSIIETRPIELRIGRWNTVRDVIVSPIPARAPFVRIGPLLNDWTMTALTESRPGEDAQTAPGRSTIGLLRKASPPGRDEPTEGWQLYMECTSPRPGDDRETLTLWIGPAEYPLAVWTISPDGRNGAEVEFVAGSTPSIGIPRVRTRVLGDRWVAAIDLPAGVFGDDQRLQLGIERIDADGLHTAWPRRMIPGQREPGRLLIRGDLFDQLRTQMN